MDSIHRLIPNNNKIGYCVSGYNNFPSKSFDLEKDFERLHITVL